MRAAAILLCYRLAKYYSRPPPEFLAMPLDEVLEHEWWTDQHLEMIGAKRPRPQNGG